MNNQILLIGMMGAGKSSIGKILSKSLDMHFYDTDDVIKKNTGVEINRIFELEGEAGFRNWERKAFLSIVEKKNIEASNDSFEKKVSIYQGKGKHGTSDDKITSFRLTQQIFDDYNSKKFTNWNFETINNRKKSLYEEIEEIFQIDLRNIK